MFPDSGVAPSDARNSTDPVTTGCNELWYSTGRCEPRFDPAAANAMLSALINAGEVVYNCASLSQVQLAVRYLIQRGLPKGAVLAGGPFDYICALDPTLTRYNNFLTLVVVPNADNQGPVTLNVDGHGPAQVLRPDGQQLSPSDLKAGIPTVITYYGGFWYLSGGQGVQGTQGPPGPQGPMGPPGTGGAAGGSGGIPDVVVFSVHGSYSWTVPAGVAKIWVRVVGAGGGAYPQGIPLRVFDINDGHLYNQYDIQHHPGGGGGGGGGWTEGPLHVSPGQTFTVLVGQGGIDGFTNISNTGQAVGGNGGTSSFAGFSATGGGGAARVYSVELGLGGGRSGIGAGGPLAGGLGHGDSPGAGAGVNNGGGPLGPGHGGDNEFNSYSSAPVGGIEVTSLANPGNDGMVAIYY
jgi:hypothetical protein